MELKTCRAFLLVLASFIEQTPGIKFGSTDLQSQEITSQHLTSEGHDMVLHATRNRMNQSKDHPNEQMSVVEMSAVHVPGACNYGPEKTVLWWKEGIFKNHAHVDQVADCDVNCVEAGTTEACQQKADAVVYHMPTRGGRGPDPHPSGQLQIAMSMESTFNHRHQEPSHLKQLGYDKVATTRPESEAQVTYFTIASFETVRETVDGQFRGVSKTRVKPWSEREGVAFVASNCMTAGTRERMKFVSQLVAAGVPVDSLGRCTPDGSRSLHSEYYRNARKEDFLQKYKVYLAFENSAEPGYVTEKIMDGYAAGAVPVYWGAPDVDNYVPPNSMIHVRNNHDIEQVAAKIKEVLSNQQKWEELVEWRQQDPKSWPAFSYEKQHALLPSVSCRMCRLAHQAKIAKAR